MSEHNEDWVVLYEFQVASEAQIVRGGLEAAGLRAVVLNQLISPYPTGGMGSAKLFVHPDDAAQAAEILRSEGYE